jgi:drug/metabolite transporter (DMT)-like permease
MLAQLWFFQALAAAMLWGIGYVLSEKFLRMGLTPSFILFFNGLVTLPVYFFITLWMGKIREGFSFVAEQGIGFLALLILMGLSIVSGAILIMLSIAGKNATVASMIEITYPLFTFLFAWLIFREAQLNWSSGVGALLIFAGIAVIYFKS